VTSEDASDYELVLTPPARRALTAKLPEPVAAAVIDFLTTALVRQPHRVGKPLRDDLTGVWSARRGTYRVLYRIRDDLREVIVLRVEHRRDAYRPL
jgi:mRNA interferase RelE/StbE